MLAVEIMHCDSACLRVNREMHRACGCIPVEARGSFCYPPRTSLLSDSEPSVWHLGLESSYDGQRGAKESMDLESQPLVNASLHGRSGSATNCTAVIVSGGLFCVADHAERLCYCSTQSEECVLCPFL